jgi:PAS domain S-box-containing protein
MKILIVDDKAGNRYLMERFLQTTGYETVSAVNGSEALELAMKNPPDMIVSDILMPVMDGFTLCREWKKDKTLQKIPFVFYTATYTDPKDEEFALSLGADCFIVKPKRMNDFLKIIKETFDAQKVKEAQPMNTLQPDEKIFLKEYNEALVRKLENKMIQVEAIAKELKDKNASLEEYVQQRKLADEAIRESEDRFRMVFENVFDGISIHNEDPDPFKRELIDCNEQYAALAGRSREELLKLGNTKTLQTTLEDTANSVRLRSLSSKTAYQGSYSWNRPDGKANIIEHVGVPITWRGKSYSIGIDRDITERKQTEESLKKSEVQLRSLVSRLESVREQERAAIAREIHDELGQQLTAIKMDIVLLSQELESGQVLTPQHILQEMGSMINLIDRTVKSVQNITTELRPWVLDNLDLKGAIEWLAKETQTHSGITCNLRVNIDDIQMDSERSGSVFRILQEALTNVVRHAKTKKVDIFAQKRSGNLFLELRDYGRGINDEELSKQMSLGILGMKERALFLGGELTIRGINGEGTTVTLSVPIQRSSQSEV